MLSSCPYVGVVPLRPAGLVLLLAKLCMFMEDSSVPYVMEVLAAGFQGRTGFRASDEPPPFVGGEVARRLGTAASEFDGVVAVWRGT
jgi:hypothetical protein